MSKFLRFINFLITLFLLLVISSNPVYAQASCSLRTEPNPLYSSASTGKFIVNVGNNNNYANYKMEFECGAPHNIDLATKEANSTTDISRTLTNSSILGQQSCEFGGGTSHTIKIFAVTPTGDVPQCIVSYSVLDTDTLCRLTINPTTGIGSATQLTIAGENLTPGQSFVLFFDNNAVDMSDSAIVPQVVPNSPIGVAFIRDQRNGNVNSPTFGPKSIPQELMTPGNHTISLRRRNKNVNINILPGRELQPIKDFFDPPFCPVSFSVTPDSKGELLAPGTNPITDVCATDPTKCSSAGGDPCASPTPSNNPGFKTAIGCIHTSPAELVKDFMTFIIGISGGLAFLMMLLGAFQMLTSAGNPETLATGKDRFTNAIIGLLFVIFAVLLLQIIGFDILKLPGFNR